MRVKVTLAGTECKQRNYDTKKNKKNELVVTQKEKVSPSSLIMIGVAVAMAALTGKSK